MTVNLSMLAGAGAQFFDNSGVILSGGLVYTYAAGTTTPQASYTTSSGSTAHTNPIVLDSAGRVASGGEIWLTDAVAYKFVLKTAAATTIGTYDNITGNASGIYAAFAASSGSSLVGYTQGGTGAVATTVQAKLRQTVNVIDFGADSTGATSSTTAIQNAINYGISLGTDFTLYFPQGTYLSGTLLLGNSNSKGTIRVSVYGQPNVTTLISTVTGSNPFLNVPTYWGYGANGNNWIFRDLTIKAQTTNNGYGIYFASLNYQIIIEDCRIEGFLENIYILSAIGPRLSRVDCGYSANGSGIRFGISATGNVNLDQPTSNTRILQCYLYNNKYGIRAYGQQTVIRDCVFQQNITYAINALGDYGLIDGNWFESTGDVIDGEMTDVTVSNNIGIASSPSSPLFTNVGDSFSLSANNNCVRIQTGEYQKRYSNVIYSLTGNNLTYITQFKGVATTFASPGTTYSGVIADSNSLPYSGTYTGGGAQTSCSSIVITETYSGTTYTYETVLISFYTGLGTISPTYLIPSGGLLSYSAGTMLSSISATKFSLYRDGATGNLGFAWSAKPAGTTAISFTIRPISNTGTQAIP